MEEGEEVRSSKVARARPARVRRHLARGYSGARAHAELVSAPRTWTPRRTFHTPTFSSCGVKARVPEGSTAILGPGEHTRECTPDPRYRRYVLPMVRVVVDGEGGGGEGKD
jgi:hypothetical protein